MPLLITSLITWGLGSSAGERNVGNDFLFERLLWRLLTFKWHLAFHDLPQNDTVTEILKLQLAPQPRHYKSTLAVINRETGRHMESILGQKRSHSAQTSPTN